MNLHIGDKPLVHRGRPSIAPCGVGDGGRRWDKIALCSASCHITLNRTASKMCARNLTLPFRVTLLSPGKFDVAWYSLDA